MNTNVTKDEMNTWAMLGSAIAKAVGTVSEVTPIDFAAKVVGLTLVGNDFNFDCVANKVQEVFTRIGASIDEEILNGEYQAIDHLTDLEEVSLGSVNMLKGAEAVVISSALNERFNFKNFELPVFVIENEEEFGFVGPFKTGVEIGISCPNYIITDRHIEYEGGLLNLKKEGLIAIIAETRLTFNVKDHKAFRKIKA